MEAADAHQTEVDVPRAVVYFLKSDVLPSQNAGHIDPTRMPTDAAVTADQTHFESVIRHTKRLDRFTLRGKEKVRTQ